MQTRAIGPQPCDYLLISDYPGKNEDKKGIPLVGKTGDEVNRYLDGVDLPHRSEIRIVNLIRTWNPSGEYSEADVARDAWMLEEEIVETEPKVIIALGRWSIRYLLGDVAVDEVQGLPWWKPDSERGEDRTRKETHGRRNKRTSTSTRCVVFPLNNPAAGFRNDKVQATVAYGFRQLSLYLQGKIEPRELFEDPYPDPTYLQVPDDPAWMRGALLGVTRLFVDSEGHPDDIWSVQFAIHPGTAYLIRLDQKRALLAFFEWMLTTKPTVVYHGSLHDFGIMRIIMQQLGLDIDRLYDVPFDDTQIMSYLLQLEPIGLKPNCVRHCNMRMQDYDEVLGDAQSILAYDYLVQVWDKELVKYRTAQKEEFERINRTPLRDKRTGKVKRNKAGQIKYRSTKVMPKLPMSDLMKAAKRVMSSTNPYKLWQDQRDDILVAAYNTEV